VSYEVLNTALNAAVATNGTISFTYPSARNAGMYMPGAEHVQGA
jgi:hypothetical protein